MGIKLDDDDGFAEVEIGLAKVRLDLFKANNVYAALCDKHEDQTERCDAWVEWLQSQGLPTLSHGNAFQLYVKIAEEVEGFKKKTRLALAESRLTRFYGIDCFALDPARKLTLEANMTILAAEEELRAGPVEGGRLYDLVLAITGSKDRASEELTKYLAEELRKNRKPEL